MMAPTLFGCFYGGALHCRFRLLTFIIRITGEVGIQTMSSQYPEQPRSRDDTHPTPEELLDLYHLRDSDIETSSSATIGDVQRTRGRLRVYLGAAAGVGKTYAMLN